MAMFCWLAIHGRAVDLQAVPIHLPAAATHLKPIKAMDRSQRLNLAIGLPLRNRAGLDQLLQQIYDPTSTNYHHYLTSEQFTERFGPTEQDYQAVMNFAKASGLTVTTVHPNRMLVDVRGSVGDIEQMLHVKMQEYQHPTEKRTFYAPDVEPSVALGVPVLSIGGLNNYSLPRPRLKHVEPVTGKTVVPNVGMGPGGGFMGKDFRTAYVPDSKLDGTGQVVGLLQFDGYTPSDITYYENVAGLPNVPLVDVLIDGANGQPSGSGGEVEVSLDIEMVISMATNISKVMVYEAPNPSPFEDLLNRMATDNIAKQLSCSWYQPGGPSNAVTDQIFQQMAAQGQSFFNASGDYCAYTGPIDFPGDTPYITQVGGTTLTTGSGGSYASETVWNRGDGVGSGGGISTQYPIPSWQTNVNMSANKGSTTMRNTPDVALTAENIYVRADGLDQTVGGTSCAAPLWAGFTALVNQQAAAYGKSPVGFVNPLVYALGSTSNYPSIFHDITTGDNTSGSSPNQFYAVPGYDVCTGWGTPVGQKLIDAFVPPIVVALPVSATEGDGLLAGAGTVTLPTTRTTDVVVALSSSDPGQVSVPADVTISAGQASGTFDLTILDDGVLDGTQTATIVASLPGVGTGSGSMTVFDKETATLQVVLPAAAIKGQGAVSGSVQVSAPVAADVTVALSSDTTNLIQVPASVVVHAGQASAAFTAAILTDGWINGGHTVTVTAHVQNWTDGQAAVAVRDNVNLTVALPASAWENAGVLTNGASVRLAGTSSTNQVISLVSDRPDKMTVPPAVTILAGSSSNTFNVTLVDNSIADGHQTVTVTAGAPGFTNGSASMLVLDDESPPLPSNPQPGDLATNVPANTNLMWSNGDFLTNQPFLNGDFETGTFTNWLKTSSSPYGDWVINNGTYVPPGPGGSRPPFAGTFSALSEQSEGGVCTLYQDVSIPSGSTSATVSWVDQICNFAPDFTTNNQYFRVEIRGTNDSLLATAFTTEPGDPLTNVWTARSFNLSAYIGQTIRIAFVESDSVFFLNVGLDNVSVQVSSPNVASGAIITNDVYFGTNPTPGSGEYRGSTTNTTWALPLLAPQTKYYWQIVAHRTGTTVGPVWQFTTAGVDHFIWNKISSPQLLDQPFNVTITAKDAFNTTVTNFTGPAALQCIEGGNVSDTIEDFESGVWPHAPWVSVTGDTFGTVSPSYAHDGNYGLSDPDWMYRTDVSLGKKSDVLSCWIRPGNGRAYLGFGASSNGCWSIAAAPNTGEFILQQDPGYNLYNEVASVVEYWETDKWYRLEVQFGSTSNVTCNLYDSDGTTLLNSLSYSGITGLPGGVALRSFDSFSLDTITSSGSGSKLPCSPTNTGTFNNGIWTGNLAVQQVATNVFLFASDGNGHSGLSSPFDVVSSSTVPIITLQPTNQTVMADQTTVFSVGAAGAQPLCYQWTLDQAKITGATNASLILPGVQSDQAGIYAVWVTNTYGSTLSSNATLTVIPAVTNCVAASSSLVSWWPAEGNAYDAVGTNNGTPVGGLNYASGEVGRAFYLNGTNAYLKVPAGFGLDVGPGTGMTLEGWINPSVIDVLRPIAEWNNGSTWGVNLWISVPAPPANYGTGPGCLYVNIVDTAGNGTSSYHSLASPPGIVRSNVFQHVAFTYDRVSGLARIYLNGAVVAQQNLGTNFTPQTGYDFYLGARVSDHPPTLWTGALDEFSLYQRALYSNDIASIYRAGMLGKCAPVPLTILSPPYHRAVALGCYALFGVMAEGNGPLAYQWWKDGAVLNTQTNSALLLTNVQTPDFGNYSVVVSDAFGSVTSAPAMLSLGHPPVAHPDVIQRFAGGGVRIDSFNLVTNDTDADGDSLRVIAVSPSGSAGGVVGLTNNWIYYAPPAGGTNTDTFTYVVDDGGCGTDVGTVTVQIKPDSLQPLNFAADNPNDGSALVRFDGVPGATYRILYTDSLTVPNWQALTNLTADSFGICQFVDWSPTNAPARYYRAVRP